MANLPQVSSRAAAPAGSNGLQCGRFVLPLDRPLVMGILNVTPDSFSDGGAFVALDVALRHADAMLEQGADIIDIGGESTRPGAQPVPLAEELARVVPVVKALVGRGVPLSIDTYKPAVMAAALNAGADLVNDIWGFRQPGALEAVAGSNCAVCAMHMAGEPRTMQDAPRYDNVVATVRRFLDERVAALEEAGVARSRIVVDPGFGFGKTREHNFALLGALDATAAPDLPILVGMSRKSMVRAVEGRPTPDRLAVSVAAALCAVQNGATIIRAHDIAATVDALRLWATARDAGRSFFQGNAL